MFSGDFAVERLLGEGRHSKVFEVTRMSGPDKGKKYAMKRYYFRDSAAVKTAVHELRILMHLSKNATNSSPLVSTLFYATGGFKTPSLIMTLASDFTLYHLRKSVGELPEKAAKFYAAEIICGLEFLHSKFIVHVDLKLENVLLTSTGHCLLTDFDWSYDIRQTIVTKGRTIFGGTYNYVPHEIANNIAVTTETDVWCLGATVAYLVSSDCRYYNDKIARRKKVEKSGRFAIYNFKRFSRDLKEFLALSMKRNYEERPSISALKELKLFADIDWNAAANCRLSPPYSMNRLKYKMKSSVDHIKPSKLKAAFEEFDPTSLKMSESFPCKELDQLFNYTHPTLRESIIGYILRMVHNVIKLCRFYLLGNREIYQS